MLLALLGSVGSLFGSFFNAKATTAGAIGSAIGEIAQADANSDMARSLPIVAEASSGSWLAVNWRPLTMMVFLAMIVSRWFGYSPPNMSPDEIGHLWYLLTCGICGYGAQRTIEKIVDKVNVGRVVGAFMGRSYNKVAADRED